MFTQKSIKIFHSVQEARPFSLFQNLALGKALTDGKCHFAIVSLFSEFEPRQKLNQSQMSFDNLMGYILSIPMCMQNFITIFHSVQETAPLSLFQNLALGKASTDDKCHLAIVSFFYFQNLNLGKNSTNLKCHLTISWGTSCQYQCVCKNSSQYFTQFKRQRHYHFFRIWSSAKPRPMKVVILQSLGLDLVNISVYATVYQNIPLSLRDRSIFTFSKFGARQSLDR